MNKKGVSEIISTVLIIVLSIVLISVLASFVINLVKLPQLSPEKSCVKMQINPPIKISNVCFNQETQELEVIVFRDNFEVFSLDFILDGEKYSCACESCSILEKQTFSKYFFAQDAEKVSVVVNGCLVETKDVGYC
jgi:hypothetical protein